MAVSIGVAIAAVTVVLIVYNFQQNRLEVYFYAAAIPHRRFSTEVGVNEVEGAANESERG